MKDDSWFPAKILLTKTNETLICKTVNDIPQGIAFRVLKIRYKEEDQ